MLVARAVVQEVSLLQGALDVAEVDVIRARKRRGRLQSIESHSRVTARPFEEGVERIGADARVDLGKATIDHLFQLCRLQGLQTENTTSRKERGDHLEGRALGGR